MDSLLGKTNQTLLHQSSIITTKTPPTVSIPQPNDRPATADLGTKQLLPADHTVHAAPSSEFKPNLPASNNMAGKDTFFPFKDI